MQLRLLFLRTRVGLHSRVDLSTRTDRPFATDRGSQRASASHRSARDRTAPISRLSAPASGRCCDCSTAAAALANLPAAATGSSATGGSNSRAAHRTAAAGHSAGSRSTRLELGTQNGTAACSAKRHSDWLRTTLVKRRRKLSWTAPLMLHPSL